MGGTGGQFVPSDSENPEHLRIALPTNAPSHEVAEKPYRCYRINTDFIGFLLAGVDAYVHTDAFIGTESERETAARRFVDLQVLLMTGNLACGEQETMKLRQNPNNPCQLEQSHDNGASWTLAFDYGLCLAAATTNDLVVMSAATANAVAMAEVHNTLYVGAYQDIAPDFGFDLSGDDELREMAYCYAVQLLLLQLGRTLTEFHADGWSGWEVVDVVAEVTKYGSALLLGLVGAGVVAVSPVVYLATTLVGVAATAVDELIDIYEPDAGTDLFILPETQADLLCCGTRAIGGMTPDFLRFSGMFDACDSPAIDGFMAAFLGEVMSKQSVYLAFLAVIQEAFEALKQGQRCNCPCDVDTITFEFTTETGSDPNTFYGLSGWDVIASQAGMMNYIPEAGVFFGDEATGDYSNFRGVAIFSRGFSGEVQSVQIEGNQAMGLQQGTGAAANITYGGDGQSWESADANPGEHATYKRIAYRELDGGGIFASLISDARFGYDDVFTGSCKLDRIIIKGRNLSVI